MSGTHKPHHSDTTPDQEHDPALGGFDSENPDLYSSAADNIDPPAPEPVTTSASGDNSSSRIAQLEVEIATLKDQAMRALAEAENTRKRSIREREDASRFAIAGFARDLLSVADNLRRALDSIPAELTTANPQIKNLSDGIAATERELLRSFEKNGIQKIEPLGLPFDPNFHEVMFEAPMPDKPHGTVIQVVEAGYTISGRILRPARVGVSKNDGAAGGGHTIDTQA